MLNFQIWKKRFVLYLLLVSCISFCLVTSTSSHRGKHNIAQKTNLPGVNPVAVAAFTVHDGLDFDRWKNLQDNPIIVSNLDINYPFEKFVYRDVTWSDGFTRQFWNPSPPENITVWLTAWVTGFGFVEFSGFSGEMTGKNRQNVATSPELKVGSVVPILPYYTLEENYKVSQELVLGPFNTAQGNYSWSASGKVKLIPYTYGISASAGSGGGGISVTWGKNYNRTPTECAGSGSWNVERKTINESGQYRCGGCSEKVSSLNAHKIPCANPNDSSEYYFCLGTEKWKHAYEDVCNDLDCGTTNFYRCFHTHTSPDPPDYPENSGGPPSSADSTAEAPSMPEPSQPITITSTITYACGNHSGSSSDSSSHVAASCDTSGHYVCDSSDHTSASCGISGHYNCDGSDHSLQASCTETDSNGNSCTVTSFYACQSHTCQYPTAPEPAPTPAPTPEPETITCARDGCSDTVNRAYAHATRCGSCGNQYWSCVASNVTKHETSISCRRSGCSNTFTRCSIPSSCPAAPNWKCWP